MDKYKWIILILVIFSIVVSCNLLIINYERNTLLEDAKSLCNMNNMNTNLTNKCLSTLEGLTEYQFERISYLNCTIYG